MRLAEAAAEYQRALAADPNRHEAVAGLARIAAQVQQYAEGLRLIERALALDPDNSDYGMIAADILFSWPRTGEALRRVEEILEREPSHSGARLLAARCLEVLDRTTEAREQAEVAVRNDPGNAHAAILLAHFERVEGAPESSERRLRGVLEQQMLDRADAQRGWHELGMTLDRLGRFDEAHEAFVACGRATMQSTFVQRIDRTVPFRKMDGYASAFPPHGFEGLTRAARRAGGRVPAFLVGFPRSGTTMTEQILAAHPEVCTGDEPPTMHTLIQEAMRLTGSGPDEERLLSRLSETDVQRLRGRFWELAGSFVPDLKRDGLYVEKMPLNLTDLPFVNLIFPEARVLVALRDPRDVCLSCFQQNFRPNNFMVHLTSLDGAARLYAATMDFWSRIQTRLTMPWMEIRYEETVTDLPAVARRMIEFLGVPWSDEVLRFHEKARTRAISTPSFAAVREQVHSRAVGRWRRYAEQIRGVEHILAPHIRALGYELSEHSSG